MEMEDEDLDEVAAQAQYQADIHRIMELNEAIAHSFKALVVLLVDQLLASGTEHLEVAVMSMDADLNMYPILIPPASNTFHFCHHPQPHHSQPYYAQSIIHHSSSMAIPDIELTQPSSQFSQYSVDSHSPFAHLLIQSSDPALKMTHAIGGSLTPVRHQFRLGAGATDYIPE